MRWLVILFAQIMYFVNQHTTILTAPPHLLFTQISPYVRRVDLDGRRLVTVYSGGQPRGIDFDYRFALQLYK